MRARGPVGTRLIAAVLLNLIIGAIGLVVFARPLTHFVVVSLIEQSGVPVRAFEVRSVGLRAAEFVGVALGDYDGPEAASIQANWEPGKLLTRRIDRLVIREARLSIEYDGDDIRIRGLPDIAPTSGGSPPVQRIDMIEAMLAVATPLGDMTVSGDATVGADDGGLRLERAVVRRAVMQVAGGTVSLKDTRYQAGMPLESVLLLDAIDLAAALELLKVDGLSGTGELAGKLPIRIDTNGFAIAGGHVSANGPGVIRYTGNALPDAAAAGDKSVSERIDLVRAALADFHYTGLALGIERSANGEGTLMVKLDGRNPAVLDGHPFAINVRFEANFDKLAAILLSGYGAARRLLEAGAR